MRLIIFILLLISFSGCAQPIKERLASPEFIKNIDRIKIYDKTDSKFIADTLVLKGQKAELIISELKRLEDSKIDNLKTMCGFYDVFIIGKDQSEYEIEVVYTIYNGIVIRDHSGKTYKNDDLEGVILYLLQSSSKKDPTKAELR